MLKEFKLPDLGEGLTESEIVSWRVSAGDRVTLNQIIADVETAKAVVELPSPFDGVVQQLHAEPGDTVDVAAACRDPGRGRRPRTEPRRLRRWARELRPPRQAEAGRRVGRRSGARRCDGG